MKRRLPAFFLLTDERRMPDPRPAVAALPPGGGVILRHYRCAGRGALAAELAGMCRARRRVFLVGGDVGLAWRVGADGVHHPRWMGRVPAVPAGWLRTASAHSFAGLVSARRRGMDAALLSPVFATASHPGRGSLGVVRFCAFVRLAGLPVYALGGVGGCVVDRFGGLAAGLAMVGEGGCGGEGLRPFPPRNRRGCN